LSRQQTAKKDRTAHSGWVLGLAPMSLPPPSEKHDQPIGLFTGSQRVVLSGHRSTGHRLPADCSPGRRSTTTSEMHFWSFRHSESLLGCLEAGVLGLSVANGASPISPTAIDTDGALIASSQHIPQPTSADGCLVFGLPALGQKFRRFFGKGQGGQQGRGPRPRANQPKMMPPPGVIDTPPCVTHI